MDAFPPSSVAPAMEFFSLVFQSLSTDIVITAVTLTLAVLIGNRHSSRTKEKQFSKKVGYTKHDWGAADEGGTMVPKWSPAKTVKACGIVGSSTRGHANSGRSSSECSSRGGLSPVGTPSPSNRLLGDDLHQEPWQVIDEVVEGVREHRGATFVAWALQRHREMQVANSEADGRITVVEAAQRSRHSPIAFYTALVQCAIKAGESHLVDGIIDEMVQLKVKRPIGFYESAMKQLAHQKEHREALSVYDRLAADGLVPSVATCSCLVTFAAEVGELERVIEFFEKLSSMITPPIRAYMTVLRVHAKRKDWPASRATFREMQRRRVIRGGRGFGGPSLNMVLATGISANLEEVEQLVTEIEEISPSLLDVFSYNTLAKGYAQRNDVNGVAGVIRRMRAKGLVPNATIINLLNPRERHLKAYAP